MTVTDGLFNFPELNFIYVHTILVYRTSEVEYVADRDGNTVAPQVVPVEANGYAAAPNVYAIGEFDDQVDCVVRIPHSAVTVDARDTIEIPAQDNIIPMLVGRYQVSTGGVRPNALDQRIFLKRPKVGTANRNNPVTLGA